MLLTTFGGEYGPGAGIGNGHWWPKIPIVLNDGSELVLDICKITLFRKIMLIF
jgi:hypothetical protein